MNTEYKLNQGQEKAADDLFKWLIGNEKYVILSGPGGVGKSYLISYLIDKIMPKYEALCDLINSPSKYNQVVLTATSNPAAENLARSTKQPVKTIHSFLNLLVRNDYSTGATKLTRNAKKWHTHHDTILIIDEYSMIDFHLFKEIKEGTVNCKIIFVGDHCQLAAVGDKIPYVSQQGIPRIDLTEQMRNKDQPVLQELCMQLRNSVESSIYLPVPIYPGVVDLLDDSQMQQEISTNFLNKEFAETNRILAYSNGRVNLYNDFIRNIRQLPAVPVVGEHLICNQVFSPKGKLARFATEEQVYIQDISESPTKISLPDDGELEVLFGNLVGSFNTITDVPIPVNRAHHQALIKYYAKKKDWITYFKLKEEFPDLRPLDASTVHKSQGSSYDTVYVDLADLSTCTVNDTASRLLYVAVSRARNRVVFYGNLTERLGGLYVPE